MTEPMSLPTTYPRRALRASIYLIAIECLILAYPSKNWLVTGVLFLCAASRWWTVRRGWSLTLPFLWNALFLASAFATKYSLAPANFSDAVDFANTRLAHEIGCWLVSVQILMLHEPLSLKRIPVVFATLGCLAVLCAGDVKLYGLSRTILLILTILFVGGLAWFSHAGRDWMKVDQSRRLRRGLMLATLCLAAVPTIYSAKVWHEHERDLESLLVNLMKMFDGKPSTHRFRTHSALDRVSNGKIFEPEKLVLRVSQVGSEPLYLRGVIREKYHLHGTWVADAKPTEIFPREAPSNQGLPTDTSLFPIHSSNSTQWNKTVIHFLSQEDPIPLAQLEAAEMNIGISRMTIDSSRNLRLTDEPLPDHLEFYTPATPEPDQLPSPDAPVRSLPKELDPRILSMAQEICAGKTTDAEKIRAIESFFRENYLYQIGLEVSAPQDRMTFFLLTQPRPAAHCEYFASGATILLRAVGVPARYVTGYVPSERYSNGDWIARRKDAHAWAEAYDSGLGRWITVEATPSEGLPERRTATWTTELSEAWQAWSRAFREEWATNGIWSILSLTLQSHVARGMLVLVLLTAWWTLNRRYKRQRDAQTLPVSSRALPFQLWLRELESHLARQGFERLPHETLLQFRNRILDSPQGAQLRPSAEWYSAYSLIRYNPSEQTTERIAQLEQTWHQLTIPASSRIET